MLYYLCFPPLQSQGSRSCCLCPRICSPSPEQVYTKFPSREFPVDSWSIPRRDKNMNLSPGRGPQRRSSRNCLGYKVGCWNLTNAKTRILGPKCEDWTFLLWFKICLVSLYLLPMDVRSCNVHPQVFISLWG